MQQEIQELDNFIYEDYRRKPLKPKPIFQSVPLDQYPLTCCGYLANLFLLILFNLLTFGFMVLMLFLRKKLTTPTFVQIITGLGFGVLGIMLVLTYNLSQWRRQQERSMFDQSLRWQRSEKTESQDNDFQVYRESETERSFRT